MWWRRNKDAEKKQLSKIEESQKTLLEAAVSTADMAQYVTTRLKEGLEDAIRQLDSTSAMLSDALIVCDSDGMIKACNPAAQRIFENDSLVKTSVLDLIQFHNKPLPDSKTLWKLLQPSSDNKNISGIRVSGKFPIEITMTRLERASGSLVMLILIRDITDLIELKRASEAHAHRYRSLLEINFDGVLVVQNDKIVAANNQAGRLFGCKAESLLRVEFEKLVNREDRQKLAQIDAPNSDIIEASALRSDGTAMTLLFSAAQIVWNEGPATLITVRDMSPVTTRHLNIVDMICCFDKNFIIGFANEAFCRYYKVVRKDIVGTDIRQLLSEAERDTFILHIGSLTPARPNRRVQVFIDGRLQDWIDHAIYDEKGNLLEIQRRGRDITHIMNPLVN